MNLFYVILAVSTVLEVSANKRVKRILFGDVIKSFGNQADERKFTSPYASIYYSVAIKPCWGKVVFAAEMDDPANSWDDFLANGDQRLETTRNNRCGGSFLTPSVVQTACHCVAHFFNTTVADKVVWEEPMVIYATAGRRKYRKDPFGSGVYSTRRYYAHKQCRLWSEKSIRIVSYDYGLITLSKGYWGSIPAGYTHRPGSPYEMYKLAPLYTAQDLNKHYLNILSRQSTCLFIGHGYTTYGNGSGIMSVQRFQGPEAEIFGGRISFTWRTITSYRYCYEFLQSVLNFTDYVMDPSKAHDHREYLFYEGPDLTINEANTNFTEEFHPKYSESGTFTCSMNAGKFQAVPTVGDGGYPVTCNNVYFAIQGMGWTKWTRMDRMSLASPITFAKWENAAEFRDDLSRQIAAWEKIKRVRFDEENIEEVGGNFGSKNAGNPISTVVGAFLAASLRSNTV